MTYQPNAELALMAWLKTVPGVDSTKVASTLPADAAKWASTGFLTVASVGGSPSSYMKLRKPVLSVSAWGVNLNSEKAPWGRTQQMAEEVVDYLYSATFPFVVSSSQFFRAVILQMSVLTEPRKVPGSTSGFAQVQMDVQIFWVNTTTP